MKQYVIDQLRGKDGEHLKNHLDRELEHSGVDGLYWLMVEDHLLSDVQQAHTACRPYYVAIELEADRLSCELLVRTRQRMRCDCIAYATEAQRNWIFRTIDEMLQQLDIRI